jgi:hypothetical protein
MTGDFTWEAWVYPTSLPAGVNYETLWAQRNTNAAFGGPLVVFNSAGALLLFISNSAASNWAVNTFNTMLTISLNQWQHIALVKNGSSLKLYKNGVAGTSTTSSEAVGTSGNTTLMAGAADGSQAVDGYMSNFRAVKGTAVYTSNFTPPTAPVTAITNTSLLTNFTNAGIIDNAMINNLEKVGNAQISTTQSKFGVSSMRFDGSGDGILIPYTSLHHLSGDFTIEFWVYWNGAAGTHMLINKGGGVNIGYASYEIYIDGTTDNARFAGSSTNTGYNLGGESATGNMGVVPTNAWTHIA